MVFRRLFCFILLVAAAVDAAAEPVRVVSETGSEKLIEKVRAELESGEVPVAVQRP